MGIGSTPYMGLTMLVLLCKIWLTLVISMVPLRILFDYSEHNWFDTVKHKIVEMMVAVVAGSIVGLFFVLVLVEVWSW